MKLIKNVKIIWYILNTLYYNQSNAIRKAQVRKMTKYECEPCGYVYDPAVGDPDGGIAPGTAFADIPDDWMCPVCGVGKDFFSPVE